MTTGPRVGLFVTCLVDLFRPSVGFAAVKLLRDAGCTVEVPPSQTCCGQPWFNNGLTEEAREIARAVIPAYEPFEYVVAPSGSCAGMIKRYFPVLFEEDAAWNERAQKIAAKTYELTDFLVRVLRISKIDAAFPARCAYHDSCSALRDLGVREQPRKLLSSVHNLTLTELSDPESCCGFGGLFATKYAAISRKIGEDKVQDIVAKGVDTLVGPDLGCLLHLSGRMTAIGAPIRVRHIAEVLVGDLHDNRHRRRKAAAMTTSPRDFVANAEAELNNPQLQAALARIKVGFQERRRGAMRLPEVETWRDEAKRLKDHVLDNLAVYLERFETKVTANGGHVHWARTSAEARDTILKICQEAGAKSVTKGKSMISEEVELNAFLIANGITAVETDLGEYIVQLRGERPSHLIAPAFHLNRADVAATFRKEHPLDPSRDIDNRPALVAEARSILREKFLAADVGITGANILIAETGTAVLVTNEGNGDLTQGMPRVCIVLTSIEKVVPTMEDAALILRLLARSATGQEMSVYTSFRSGPRAASDSDGPEEFHVVLLDNGRTAMLESPARDALRCIRCGACMNHCPVYAAVGGHAYGTTYPGPIGAVLNPSLLGIKEAHHHPNASTLCGRCEAVCPVRIPLPSIMRSWREAAQREKLQSGSVVSFLRLWHFAAKRPALYRILSYLLARTIWIAGGRHARLRLLSRLIGWGPGRDLPAPQGPTFHSQWALRKSDPL